MAATLRINLPVYFWAFLVLGSCKGLEYQNFSCITYNWDEYLTCSWTPPPRYSGPVYKTAVNWQLPPFGDWMLCPELTSDTCTWSLGGDSQNRDTDPHQPISVRLELWSDNTMLASEYHKVDIEDKVQPATVSDLVARPQSPNCIFAQWTHEKEDPSKLYSIEISSPGSNTITKIVRVDTFYDSYDSADLQTGGYTNVTFCNLSYFVNYTISVTVRAIDMDDTPIGYWSDSQTINAVTPKSVPSGPPHLPPGGYTLSAVNDKGYRLARVYWASIPTHVWNGETMTYELEAVPVDGCGFRIIRVSSRDTSAEFDIMYTCSYRITVWTRNEIGRSKGVSGLLLEHNALPRPREVFRSEGHTDRVTISWHEPKDVNSTILLAYTVYWCPKSPTRLCKGSFNYTTVSSPVSYGEGYLRASVLMAGYPNITYMYGVSADLTINGTVTSSGFVWTDCSMQSTDKLRSPRISFKGYPSDDRVRVTWLYQNCARAMIRNSNSVHYNVTSCSSDTCEELSTDQAFVDLHSIFAGQDVCVKIAVSLDTVAGPTSSSHCYTQSLQGNKYPVHAVLVFLTTLSGVAVLILIVTISCIAFRWWKKPVKLGIPTISTRSDERDQSATGDSHRPLVTNGSAVSSGRTTLTAESALIANDS